MSRKNETDGSLLRVDAGSESLTAGWHRRKRRRKRRAEYEEGALRVKGRFINEVSWHHDTTIREWTFGTEIQKSHCRV